MCRCGSRWRRYKAAGAAAKRAEREGLATVAPGDRLVLTHRGRLLTDAVVRDPLVP